MAIKKQVDTVHGFSVNDAYHRVENVTIIGKQKMAFSVKVYKDIEKQAFSEVSFNCAYDLSGSNPIAQAYNHLKTLPEFAGAVDC
jgi:hypothetical protein